MEVAVATKHRSTWKQERATDRKYSGGDSQQQPPPPGERSKFWVSGYTRADGRKVEGYWKSNPAHKATS